MNNQMDITTRDRCWLIMEEEWLRFQFQQEKEITNEVTLPLGYKLLVTKFFKQDIPTEAETEYAINYIEDELMSNKTLRNELKELYIPDKRILEVFQKNGSSDYSYSRQRVEDLFSRYAYTIMGGAITETQSAITREDFSTILILREILHHLNFETIHLA